MISSTPKVGDQVRGTVGDSIIVGRVTSVDFDDFLRVRIDGTEWNIGLVAPLWTVEVLLPPIPPITDVDGTICRGSVGFPVWRDGRGWRTHGSGDKRLTLDLAQMYWGPLVELVPLVPALT